MNFRGKPYAFVGERLHEFRQRYPIDKGWTLKSKCILETDKKVVFRASVISPEGKVVATGFAEEVRGAGNINKSSCMENCETSAWGRCLANAGFAPDGKIASAEEMQQALIAQENYYRLKLDEDFGLTEGQMHRWCMTNNLGAWDELKDKEKDKLISDLKDGILTTDDIKNPKTIEEKIKVLVAERKLERKKGTKHSHDPTFSPGKFAAQLKEVGYKLDPLSAFCEIVGYGRPSSWNERNRERFLERLRDSKLEQMPPAVCAYTRPKKRTENEAK